MDNDHIKQIQKAELAVRLIDKVLPHLPDYGVFHFAYYAKDVLKWSDKEVQELVTAKYQIIDIALNHFKYIDEKTEDFHHQLTDIGRHAKSKGGHFAYQRYLEQKRLVEAERLQRKDKTEQLELTLKQWQLKTKWYPYFISTFALIVSVLSYFRPDKKQLDLQPMQLKIQLLQDRVQSLDSLFQLHNLPKKDTVLLR
jgi:hypothetical protein